MPTKSNPKGKSPPPPKRPKSLFKGAFLTKGDIRNARIELLRTAVNKPVALSGSMDPFLDTRGARPYEVLTLAAQLLTEIEIGLPDGPATGEEFGHAGWNAAVAAAVTEVRRRQEMWAKKGKAKARVNASEECRDILAVLQRLER